MQTVHSFCGRRITSGDNKPSWLNFDSEAQNYMYTKKLNFLEDIFLVFLKVV